MKTIEIVLAGFVGFVLLLAVIIGFWWIGTYNGLVSDRQTVTTNWSNVETEYQRRFDLIPNLVAATKGILTQEQKVFGQIADARTHYAGTSAGSDARVQATGQYDSAISRLLVVMENYPQLQSNQNVRDLTVELEGTENRVSVARMHYNDAVQTYDTEIHQFPESFVAGFGGFGDKPLFESTSSASVAPVVNLTN